MDIKKFMEPQALEKNSFLWSQARLYIAAVALFLGGVPPILFFNPFSLLSVPLGIGLLFARLISGAAAGYLLYRWYKNQQMIFGGKDPKDLMAFFVSIVSGLNLGFVGIFGINIGMRLFPNYFLFIAMGVAYIVSAMYLHKRWKASGEKLF